MGTIFQAEPSALIAAETKPDLREPAMMLYIPAKFH